MRWSKALIQTLKEDPADAEIPSHRLMFRSGMLLKVAPGIHDYQPLMVQVMHQLEALIRTEMSAISAQEVFLPVLAPAELWKESGRYDAYGAEMMRLEDRHEKGFVLGPTHEEVITDLVRRQVTSYRQLPLSLYQIQTKFRDEIRPRFGIMRAREFLMKDGYSFHATPESLDKTYDDFYGAYKRILDRIGVRWAAVSAEGGAIGGHFTQEFMVLADTGEEPVLWCPACGHADKEDNFATKPSPMGRGKGEGNPERSEGRVGSHLEKISTPGARRVEQVCAFLKIGPEKLVKTLVYTGSAGNKVAVLLRGDRQVQEAKLKALVGIEDLRLASLDEVKAWTGVPAGFTGPVHLKGMDLVADHELKDQVDLVCGANEVDHHYQGLSMDRDLPGLRYADLRKGLPGDPCGRCGKPVQATRGIEVGHIFKLGTKYSEALSCLFTDDKGQKKPMIMGCYGFGVTRMIGAIIEQCHDEKGISWPIALAPYKVVISVLTQNDPDCVKTSENLYEELKAKGVDVLLDDRDVGAGFKFKDADLIGIPLRVSIGARSLKEGKVEFSLRSGGEPEKISPQEVVSKVLSYLS